MNKIQSTSLFVILALTLTMSAITPNLANAQTTEYETRSTENQIDVSLLIKEYNLVDTKKSKKLALFKLPLDYVSKIQIKKGLTQDNLELSAIRADLRDLGVFDFNTFMDNPESALESMNTIIELEHGYRLNVDEEPVSCNEECRTLNLKIGYYYTCFEEFFCATFALDNIATYVVTEKTQSISIVVEDPLEITPFHIIYSEYDNRSVEYNTYLQLTSTYDTENPYSTLTSNQYVHLYDGFDRQVVIDDKTQFVTGDSIMLVSFNIQEIIPR